MARNGGIESAGIRTPPGTRRDFREMGRPCIRRWSTGIAEGSPDNGSGARGAER